jgi:hypothetical protein
MTKNPELQGQKDSDQLSIKLEKAVREREPPPPERKTTLQAIAARNIKRESKTGKKLEVVRAWVDHEWEVQVSRWMQGPVRYVDNMPVPAISFIAEGVRHFRLDRE